MPQAIATRVSKISRYVKPKDRCRWVHVPAKIGDDLDPETVEIHLEDDETKTEAVPQETELVSPAVLASPTALASPTTMPETAKIPSIKANGGDVRPCRFKRFMKRVQKIVLCSEAI